MQVDRFPGGPVEEAVGYQLKRAQHALHLATAAALRPAGLTPPQYAVLAVIERAAGLSGAELARRAFVTPQTMSAIVAGLERAGLVVRRPHATHGRVLEAYLTAAGEERLRMAHRAVFDIQEDMMSGLSAAERGQFSALLRRCAEQLEARVRPTRRRTRA